jgi:hypothetical protein
VGSAGVLAGPAAAGVAVSVTGAAAGVLGIGAAASLLAVAGAGAAVSAPSVAGVGAELTALAVAGAAAVLVTAGASVDTVVATAAGPAVGSASLPVRLRERPRRADAPASAGSAAGRAWSASRTSPSPVGRAAWLARRDRRAGGGPPGKDAVAVVSTVVTWNCGDGMSSTAGADGTLGADGALAGGAPPGNEAAPRGRPGETGRSELPGAAPFSAGSAALSGNVGVPEGSRSDSDRDWSWEAMVLLTKLGRPPTGAAESRCALGVNLLPPAQAEKA